MSTQSISEHSLAELPAFRGMDDAERDEVVDMAQRVSFEAGKKIITQGNIIRNLWFIIEGHCEVTCRTESGCQLKLAELGPFTQFGEMSFFHAAPHSADVIALTPVKLLRLAREDYDKLYDSGNPVAHQLALNSLVQLAERLRRTDQWITNLVCKVDHHPTPSEWTAFREICFRGQ